MTFLAWIVVGVLAGWLASIVMGTNRSQGMLMDLIMGVLGAVAGGAIVSLFGFEGTTGINLWSIGVAVLGAVTLTWVARMFNRSEV